MIYHLDRYMSIKGIIKRKVSSDNQIKNKQTNKQRNKQITIK